MSIEDKFKDVNRAREDAFLMPSNQFMQQYDVTRRQLRAWRRDTFKKYDMGSSGVLYKINQIPRRIKIFMPCIELIMQTYREDIENYGGLNNESRN